MTHIRQLRPPRRWRAPLAVAAAGVVALGFVTTLGNGSAFAAETSPVGYASMNGGTTGGSGGPTVTVTSASALDSALQSSTRQTVRISGIISITGMHKVASNKTIVGVGSNSGLSGGGLNLSNVSNIIIRNLILRNADDDFITVSWNHFHNHDKTALLGHDDGNGAQDIGHLRVTYHHNWFDGTTQRHPRVRFANPVHVYNNYYNGNGGYGVASTM